MQTTLAAARANQTKMLHAEQEMQAEKRATLADSDQFFETAAKMQNSNDELKQELATEKQTEATIRAKVTELTQNLESQATANKFQEQQLLDRLSAKTAKLNKDEAILKRFRAQVQQMADTQKAAQQKSHSKASASKSTVKKTGKAAVKKIGKIAGTKVAHEPASKQLTKTRSTPATPPANRASQTGNLAHASLASKSPEKPAAANATKRLRGSA